MANILNIRDGRRGRPAAIRVTAAGAVMVAATLLAACSSSSSTSAASAGSTSSAASSSSSAAASAQPFIIGETLAKTGLLGTYDESVIDGAQYAANQFNKEGGILGHPIKFVSVDTASVIANEGPAATKVISEGAQAVLVSSGLAFGLPAAIVASAHKIPSFVAEGDSTYGVASAGPYAYNVANVSPLMGTGMGQWAYQKGYRKLWLLVDTSYSNNTQECDYAAAEFKSLGGTVVGTSEFKNSDPSIATQVNTIRTASTQPDLIAMCSYPPGGVTALRDIRSGGVQTAIVADESMDGNYWIKGIPTLSNFYYTAYTSLFGDDPVAEVNTVNKAITAATGQAPQTGLGTYGYCMVQAIRDAAQQAGSISGTALMNALNHFTAEPLACGNTTFTSTSHYSLDRLVRIMQVQNGKFSYLTGVTVKALPTGVSS